MGNQLAEISGPVSAIHPCPEADLREFERSRLVRCVQDMHIGQHVRRASRNLIEGNPGKARPSRVPGSRRQSEDLRQLIIRSQAKIQIVICHDRRRDISLDNLQTHSV